MLKLLKGKGYWSVTIWALLILLLTIVPSNKIPKPPDWGLSLDKLVHFFLFVILSFLLLYGGHSRGRTWNQIQIVLVILMLTLYGILLESVQLLIPGRDFSWADAVANCIGVITGCYIFYRSIQPGKGAPLN